MLRESRIGNMLRSSVYERVQKRQTVVSDKKSPGVISGLIKKQSSTSDSEGPRKSITNTRPTEKKTRSDQKPPTKSK